jgi:phage gp46-like protein
MSEYIIRPGADGFEIVAENGSVVSGDSLVVLTYMYLFTWRRAREEDELPYGISDKQGFWGDGNLGCGWWLRARMICNEESLRIIRKDAEEALLPLMKKEIVSSIVVKTSRPKPTVGMCTVTLYEPDGAQTNVIIQDIWGAINATEN